MDMRGLTYSLIITHTHTHPIQGTFVDGWSETQNLLLESIAESAGVCSHRRAAVIGLAGQKTHYLPGNHHASHF